MSPKYLKALVPLGAGYCAVILFEVVRQAFFR